jgi:hypothetical protein
MALVQTTQPVNLPTVSARNTSIGFRRSNSRDRYKQPLPEKPPRQFKTQKLIFKLLQTFKLQQYATVSATVILVETR